MVLAAALAATGCGNTYRPVVSSINPVGPAGQATKYAVVISNPSANAPGLVTFVDVFGDSVLVAANIDPVPQYLQLDSSGGTGFTLHADGTMNSFTITTSLLTSQVLRTTLLPGANPISLSQVAANTYVAEGGLSAVAQLTGSPPALQQEIPTGSNPVYTVGANTATRVYALSVGDKTAPGLATPIETTSNTPDAPITVGVNPVYGVMTADTRRAFVMNKGSNSVSVINAQTNALDTFTNSSKVVTSTIPVGVAPVWADFAPTRSELLVANSGTGTSNGSVSIISIPLCSTTAVDNPNCDPANPVDATGFGTTVATVPVGVNPIMIAVLQDGTKAYVANAGNVSAGIAGSISVIDLNSNTVTATLPAVSGDTNLLDTAVHGHPNWIAVTTGTPTGKVYVTAPDSTDMTVMRTDIDVVTAHINLQGNGVAVRVTAP
ncbi:YncE family protein [Granulicella sp. WH15]|nr:YncE family protein [Granulicella sp. WH15]